MSMYERYICTLSSLLTSHVCSLCCSCGVKHYTLMVILNLYLAPCKQILQHDLVQPVSVRLITYLWICHYSGTQFFPQCHGVDFVKAGASYLILGYYVSSWKFTSRTSNKNTVTCCMAVLWDSTDVRPLFDWCTYVPWVLYDVPVFSAFWGVSF